MPHAQRPESRRRVLACAAASLISPISPPYLHRCALPQRPAASSPFNSALIPSTSPYLAFGPLPTRVWSLPPRTRHSSFTPASRPSHKPQPAWMHTDAYRRWSWCVYVGLRRRRIAAAAALRRANEPRQQQVSHHFGRLLVYCTTQRSGRCLVATACAARSHPLPSRAQPRAALARPRARPRPHAGLSHSALDGPCAEAAGSRELRSIVGCHQGGSTHLPEAHPHKAQIANTTQTRLLAASPLQRPLESRCRTAYVCGRAMPTTFPLAPIARPRQSGGVRSTAHTTLRTVAGSVRCACCGQAAFPSARRQSSGGEADRSTAAKSAHDARCAGSRHSMRSRGVHKCPSRCCAGGMRRPSSHGSGSKPSSCLLACR